MNVFGDVYARYYDLLYSGKDYAGEAAYIDRIIQRFRPGAATVLELGSGTGKHASALADLGYAVQGIERSETMLAIAKGKERGDQLTFTRGDIRSFRFDRSYDSAIALFHVMSYLDGNKDLAAAIRSVHEHLTDGGVFLFDCWYGPAVLTERPTVRVKKMAGESLDIIRLAEPELIADRNVVDVHYHILARDKGSSEWSELTETHRMRYLFTPEVELLLNSAGLELAACYEFLTDAPPGFHSWNVLYVGIKR